MRPLGTYLKQVSPFIYIGSGLLSHVANSHVHNPPPFMYNGIEIPIAIHLISHMVIGHTISWSRNILS